VRVPVVTELVLRLHLAPAQQRARMRALEGSECGKTVSVLLGLEVLIQQEEKRATEARR
jgi:hypothetical protein